MKIKTKWIPVRHSGFGYAGKEGFKQGLEPRAIYTKGELNLVLKAGGVAFDSYGACDDYCESEMYGESITLYPHAQGQFSSEKLDGLHIYVPVNNLVRR